MEKNSGRRAVFPFYLPAPDPDLSKWVGAYLRDLRAKKRTPADVAKAAKVSVGDIERLEQGSLHQNLGQFRYILRHGYGCKFEDVLAKCYEEFRDRFDQTRKRRFARDYHYSLCLDEGNKTPTPLLVGGDQDNFLWAVPLRKLKKQPMAIDLLELAPARKRKSRGITPDNAHDGVEVVHVMHGTVQVRVDGAEGSYSRTLKHGDSIHYHSSFAHQIQNDGSNTSALLLIVRLPEFPAGKS
jgi:transcriptional regulator with XRE-family HTH domain